MAAIATLARWPAAYLAGDVSARPTWQQRWLAGLPGRRRGGEAGSRAGVGLTRRDVAARRARRDAGSLAGAGLPVRGRDGEAGSLVGAGLSRREHGGEIGSLAGAGPSSRRKGRTWQLALVVIWRNCSLFFLFFFALISLWLFI